MDLIKTLLIVVCTAFIAILFYDKTTFINSKEATKNVSKTWRINAADEFVVTETISNEDFSRSSCTGGHVPWVEWCLGWGTAGVSLDAYYKYHVKFSELKYTLDGETLVFSVPDLYLSAPSFRNLVLKCGTTGFGSCSPVYESLLPNVEGYLYDKGMLGLQNARENAAKSLADNFFEFAKNNNNLFFKKISVTFVNENSKSSRVFDYSNGYCGGDSCIADFKIGDFGVKLKVK